MHACAVQISYSVLFYGFYDDAIYISTHLYLLTFLVTYLVERKSILVNCVWHQCHILHGGGGGTVNYS